MEAQSSIYAISRIRYAETSIKKIVWISFLLLGVFGSSYQIFKFFRVYLTYPVQMSLHENPKSFLDFPAVTICNFNRMKAEFEYCKNNDILERGCKERISVSNGGGGFGMVISERRDLLSCKKLLDGNINKETMDSINFLTRYMVMDLKNQQLVSQKADELIRYCAFDGYACSPDDFTLFQSLKFGNCYTFNKENKNDLKEIKLSSLGYSSGLELVLNVNRSEYLSVTHHVGVHVLVHDPNENPSPSDKGVNISPGFETSIALKQTVIRRLPAPYRDQCRDYRTQGSLKNAEECLKACLQQRSLEKCECVDPTLPHASNVKHCNMRNQTDVCCMEQVQDDITTVGPACDCPLACFSVHYEQQISKAVWPSEESIVVMGNKTRHQHLMYLRHNSLRLKIYFASLMQKEFIQIPMFVGSEIFSNLGNELALWLGFSLFALFEIIEIVIFMFIMCFATKKISVNKKI